MREPEDLGGPTSVSGFLGSYKQAPGLAEHLLQSHLPVKPLMSKPTPSSQRAVTYWPRTGLCSDVFHLLKCHKRHKEADTNTLIKYPPRSASPTPLAAECDYLLHSKEHSQLRPVSVNRPQTHNACSLGHTGRCSSALLQTWEAAFQTRDHTHRSHSSPVPPLPPARGPGRAGPRSQPRPAAPAPSRAQRGGR